MLLLGAAPASQPSHESQIRQWFNQLADSDGTVREKAIENLMGISGDDLPILHKIAEQSRPLVPSQTVVLKDIVTQVYLANQKYETLNQPFLGIGWSQDRFDLGQNIIEPTKQDEPGLPIKVRLPGFDAYRMLRDGDVVLAIQTRGGRDMAIEGDNFQDRSKAFTDIAKTYQIGDTIALRVVRDGRQIIVRVLLRPKPADLEPPPPEIEPWIDEHSKPAEDYWTQHFADLVGEELS